MLASLSLSLNWRFLPFFSVSLGVRILLSKSKSDHLPRLALPRRFHFTYLPYLSRSTIQIATYDAICHVHPQGICNICIHINVSCKSAMMLNPFFTPSQHRLSEMFCQHHYNLRRGLGAALKQKKDYEVIDRTCTILVQFHFVLRVFSTSHKN